MNRLRHISAIAAAAFAAGLSFTITACSDSSSTNSEGALEPIGADYALGQEHASETVLNEKQLDSAYCDSVTRLEVPYTCGDSLGTDGIYYKESGYLRQEAAGCTYKCQNNKWSFVPAKDIPGTATIVSDYDRLVNQSESASTLLLKKCNAESEGLVQTSTTAGTPKYGYDYIYYRCEQGNWVERPAWVKCDTAGVTEGEFCRLQTYFRGIQFGEDTWKCYKYAGNGSWNDVDCPADQDKKCDAESEGVLDSSWSENNPKYGKMMYYRCESGSWVERDQWVTCDMEGVAKGDTCRKFEHKGFFYQYAKERVFVYEGDGAWKELPSEQPQNDFPDCSDFEDGDETHYCPTDEVCDNMKLYVCKDGTWTLAEEQK